MIWGIGIKPVKKNKPSSENMNIIIKKNPSK
jgi:hypothetical protein